MVCGESLVVLVVCGIGLELYSWYFVDLALVVFGGLK